LAAVLCFGLALSGIAHAERRVLFGFDEAGVRVHRIVDLQSAIDPAVDMPAKPFGGGFHSDAFNSARNASGDNEQAATLTTAVLTWLDKAGETVSLSRIADPREAHSPDHLTGVSPSRVGLTAGAWVATAPDSAVAVVVEFPERTSLGLGAQTWTLTLGTDQLLQ
jgi:hypothetical protein